MTAFSIKTAPQTADWNGLVDVWRAADDIELFETAWNFDHLYPLRSHPSNPCMESWTTLTALAQVTSRLRIGSMVNGMHFRHPAVTANMAASLDIISGGRLNLGLGAGWYEPEDEAYGLGLGTVRQRMDRFEEGVEVIVDLLSNETTTFDGEYYQLKDAWCEPKGPQRPHPPIAIGGKGEKRTLRIVAKWAAWWDALMSDRDEWVRLNDVLLGHCEAVGRDPSEITRSVHVQFAEDTPHGQIAERAATMFDAGVDVVILSMREPFTAARVEAVADVLSEL
jgi:F420-dependent oxidoreductase-like protein